MPRQETRCPLAARRSTLGDGHQHRVRDRSGTAPGRGYAAAVTAGVTARELAAGATGCMLFAETANPRSNGVYRRIGYRDVGGAMEVTFGAAG